MGNNHTNLKPPSNYQQLTDRINSLKACFSGRQLKIRATSGPCMKNFPRMLQFFLQEVDTSWN